MLPRNPLLLLFSAWLLACTGTDTGNPPLVADFGNTGCKSAIDALAQQRLKGDVAASDGDAGYQGRHCFVWERVDEHTLRIELTNYESGCHADEGWVPRAKLREDGSLDLILDDHDCSAAACGWCIYDLSFTVELDDSRADREVRISQSGCDDESRKGRSAMLPLATQDSGAVCDYAHYHALQDRALQETGAHGAYLPCGPLFDDDPPVGECEADFACTDVGPQAPSVFAGGPRCLPVCEADADCDALSRCDGGTCKLRDRGVTRF